MAGWIEPKHLHKYKMPLRAMAACFLLFSTSCGSSSNSYPDLYDKPGFDSGRMPDQRNPNAPMRVAPDYYYRQPSPYAQQPQPAPVYQQQYQQPAYPPYAQPYGSPYGAAGSRFYSNPYAIPPSPQYPQYDADQYYVPPAYQNGVEPQQQQNNISKSNRAY